MKHTMYRLFITAILFAFVIISLPAVTYDTPMHVISPVMSAVGGPHVTMNEGFSSLLNNPAGFKSTQQQISIAELTAGLKGPVFDIATMMITNNLSTLPSIMQGIYAGLDLLGPLSFGYVGNGLGFGIYNSTISSVASTGPLTVNVTLGEEVAIFGGYSFGIPLGGSGDQSLDMGVLLKGTFKGVFDFEESVLNIMNLSADTVMSKPFDFITGIGFDIGARYSYRDIFTFGLVGRDVFSPSLHTAYSSIASFGSGGTPTGTSYGIVPFALDAGIMYSPHFSKTNLFISKLKFFADYYNILDFWLYPSLAINPLLHVGLGTEVTILEILHVRAGMYQGLFSAGLGLDLHYFALDAAMFGTELSTEPGLHPVYNVQLGVSFRI